jgi:hypothetical protein
VKLRKKQTFFSLLPHPDWFRVPPICLTTGIGKYPGARVPEREADYSTPSSAEVKNMQNFNLIPPHVFVSLPLRHGGNTCIMSINVSLLQNRLMHQAIILRRQGGK